jgi:5-(carboxyamino)imidazole ribonucleotide mutase
MSKPLVASCMGSDSDLEAMNGAAEILEQIGVPYEMTVAPGPPFPGTGLGLFHLGQKTGPEGIIAGAWLGPLTWAESWLRAPTLPVIASTGIIPAQRHGPPLLAPGARCRRACRWPPWPWARGGARNAALLAVQMLALSRRGPGPQAGPTKRIWPGPWEKKAARVEKGRLKA